MAPTNLFKSVELLKIVDQTSLLATMENVYPDIYNAQEKQNAPMGPMKNSVVSVLILQYELIETDSYILDIVIIELIW